MRQLWVIEKRIDGHLDFSRPQPEELFGLRAITGISEDDIAEVVYRRGAAIGQPVLDGREIARWPSHLNSAFVARRKTW